MTFIIKKSWQLIIEQEASQYYYGQLIAEIAHQRAQGIKVFPLQHDVFNAFSYCELADVKVVILGQDPYHGEQGAQSQAHGLAFSVKKGITVPPSLKNIYKELNTDIQHFNTPEHGDLSSWAAQGVLLLNSVLTVQQGKAHSHAKLGWERFTDVVIAQINKENPGCVFVLWGAHAHKKGKVIDSDKHLILSGVHPSPLSAYRGFFGCQHFSKANYWLQKKNRQVIDWRLPRH